MTSLDDVQQRQEDEYSFPYHYIAQFRPGFSQSLFDSWGINYVATIEFLLELLAAEPFQSLVDIGCGDGRLVREIQSRFPERSVEGIDLSSRAIALARAMYPAGRFEAVDVTQEARGRQFDIATLIEVFEHIPPDAGAPFIDAVSRLIRPGGTLLLTVPHANKPLEEKHYRHFTATSITECLDARFEIIAITPFERHGLRKLLIDALLGNRLFILNHRGLLNWTFRYYKRALFRVPDERYCARLLVKARRREQ